MVRLLARLLPLFGVLACSVPPPPTNDDAAHDTAKLDEVRLLVHGGSLRRTSLTAQELDALGGEDLAWTFRDQRHTYRALRLDRLLVHLGFDPGPGGPTTAPANRRPGWRAVLVARARDGFWSPFTLAELMPDMGPTRAYVAWRRDGLPIGGDEGPLRLVVPTDLKGSRAVRMLTELEVFDGAQWLAAMPRAAESR